MMKLHRRFAWILGGAVLAASALAVAQPAPPPTPAPAPAPPPGERREDRKDRREDRKERREDAKERREDAKERREDAKERREDGKEGAEDDKGRREGWAKRRDERRKELRAKWGDDLVKRPEARAALKVHAWRMARLTRLRALAVEAKKDDAIKRIDKLLEKERARHDRKMTAVKAKGRHPVKRTLIAALAAVLLVACDSAPPEPKGSPPRPPSSTVKSAKAAASASASAPAVVASAAPAVADDLPTEADFEDQAEKELTSANLDAELDKLDKEIATD